MSVLAAHLRARTRADVARLTPAARIQLALALGDDDLRLYCAASGRSEDEARRHFRCSRHRGRRPSLSTSAGDR
jgi:hypothetical protein